MGRAFLWEKEDQWPKEPDVSDEIKEVDPEIKKGSLSQRHLPSGLTS